MTEGWNGFDIGSDLTPDGQTWEDAIPVEERLGGPSEWGNSRWKTFLQCPWKYRVYYVLGLRPAVSHPRYEALMRNLWIGGLYHEARARYYLEHFKYVDSKGVKILDAEQDEIDEACTKAMFRMADLAEKVQPTIAAEARRLLLGWITLNGPRTSQDDRCSTMYVEHLIETRGDGFPYSTRIDRILWDDQLGGVCIQEHKTASWYSENLLASYRTDPQILGQIYCWDRSPLKEQHGPLAAVEVDIAVKAKQREFYRHRVPVNMEAVEDWARCMMSEYVHLMMCAAHDSWPRRRANCFLWARPCELHEVCAECPSTEESKRTEFPGFSKPSKK